MTGPARHLPRGFLQRGAAAVLAPFAISAVSAPAADAASDLFNARFCFACHSVSREEVKKIGPYVVDVAAKYGGVPDSRSHLVKKILEGSRGVWGDPAASVMPPNKVTPEEAELLVAWLLRQK